MSLRGFDSTTRRRRYDFHSLFCPFPPEEKLSEPLEEGTVFDKKPEV